MSTSEQAPRNRDQGARTRDWAGLSASADPRSPLPPAVAPAFEEFEKLAGQCNCVPLVATLMADDLTPVSAFARLQRDCPRAFLLESVVGGEQVARYSFLGADPALTMVARRDGVHTLEHRTGRTDREQSGDPLAVLENLLRGYRTPAAAGLRTPGWPRFLGGAVGYAAYDMVRFYEHLPNAPADDRSLPDLLFDIYESMVIFDHVRKVVLVVAHANLPAGAAPGRLRATYDAALARIEALVRRLNQPVTLPAAMISLPVPVALRWTSNLGQPDFERIVARCQEYIRAGDIFQVVPSQRLLVETPADPLAVYRALRIINPSPFMFYLKSPELILVGASPEIMCRIENGLVTTRPLAGTRPRGQTPQEDRRLREELLADPKERAEHIMLVDLGRNDVGRVAKPGSVRISDVMTVEYYSHVMHISSTVTGELAAGRTALDALRATLPVGTVSGAPKVRAMQIIDECEPTRRGPYGGAVGYIDFAGDMDMCIALRTLVVQPRAEGSYSAYIQVGAGVVADSVPACEYQETLNKAQSLLSAISLAENVHARARLAVGYQGLGNSVAGGASGA